MKRFARTDHPIHDVLAHRHSPYVFDATRNVAANDVDALIEAARWTMSSYNEQPWRYIIGSHERSPGVWQQVLDVLLDGNKPWAQHAPVLMLGCIETLFTRNGKPNKAAAHDLGAASASLTVEATARGLCVHQMIGIDPDKAHAAFGLTDSMEALTALAIGYAGDASASDADYAERDSKPRERKAMRDIVWTGR